MVREGLCVTEVIMVTTNVISIQESICMAVR